MVDRKSALTGTFLIQNSHLAHCEIPASMLQLSILCLKHLKQSAYGTIYLCKPSCALFINHVISTCMDYLSSPVKVVFQEKQGGFP